MSEENEGIEKGQACNRNGCHGIISEHDSDGSCSCHINPPCSHCTTAREYCPECGWEASDDQYEYDKAQADYWNSEAGKKVQQHYQEQDRKWQESQKIFWDKFRSDEVVEELDYRIESHTHFSQKVSGCYPPGKLTEDMMKKIRGTFGGRFQYNSPDRGRFVYIAYTD
jgi:hypothetical protein